MLLEPATCRTDATGRGATHGEQLAARSRGTGHGDLGARGSRSPSRGCSGPSCSHPVLMGRGMTRDPKDKARAGIPGPAGLTGDADGRRGVTMNPGVPTRPIDPRVRIGHVHLKVADLERALRFYCGVLGFELTQRYGAQAAFVSAGGYHHHINLNTWESQGGSPAPPGTTGLYHVAILYPTRKALADALRRLIAAGITLDGASDHGVGEALYLR